MARQQTINSPLTEAKPDCKGTLPVMEKGKKTERLTATRIGFLAKNIAEQGWTKDTVTGYVQENWGLSPTQASRYYYSAVRYLVPSDPEFRESLIDKNVARLEKMIEQAMQEGDKKLANDLIKTLNSMLSVGGTKIAVGQYTPDGAQQVIEITFD